MTKKTNSHRPASMSYSERLANYEREKMNIPKNISSDAYEISLKLLAKKWKI